MYQHLREKDDEVDEDDDDNWNHVQTKRSNSNLHELDGITEEHARVIEESDIITTFLNNNGKTNNILRQLFFFLIQTQTLFCFFFYE